MTKEEVSSHFGIPLYGRGNTDFCDLRANIWSLENGVLTYEKDNKECILYMQVHYSKEELSLIGVRNSSCGYEFYVVLDNSKRIK